MGALQMRPYQQAAREAIHAEWNDGRRRTLLVLPTGTGKTIVFCSGDGGPGAQQGAASLVLARIAANCWNRPRIKSNGARGWRRLWKKQNRPVWTAGAV